MNQVVYAIGDVHGRVSLLRELHDHIALHHQHCHPNATALIVHLGDYVDRGPCNLAVIDHLRLSNAPFPSVCLLGNHEDMLLQCTQTDDSDTWRNWVGSGGLATLGELGFDPSQRDPRALSKALGAERLEWLRSLPLTYQTASHLFVHAGLRPYVKLTQQSRRDLLWIRSAFLNSNYDHGWIVVHGHTPSERPVVRSNRIGLDVSPFGQLAAAVISDASPLRMLYAR